MEIHVDHYAQYIAHFVRQIFHQLVGIVQPYYIMRRVIIQSKEDATSIGVCEAANPFEVLVFPDLLVFYVLTFVHTKLV